jgi:hypothetical protein
MLIVGVTIARHEIWRDEAQAWTIATSSSSIADLFRNMRYEGHPALWYLLLFFASKISRAPQAMQCLQFAIATVNLYLVIRCAPFSRLHKALFAGGYFVLFEYGTISRSYSLGFLLITCSCVVACTRHRWPWVSLPLALLALTSAFGALVAVALLIGLLVDWSVASDRVIGPGAGRVVASSVVVVAAIVDAYIQAEPHGAGGPYRSWKTTLDAHLLASSLAAILKALAPVPKLQRAFWGTSLYDGHTALAAVAGCGLFVGIAWLVRRRPGACVMWLLGCALVIGFLYSKIQYANASRFDGHIFLLLMAVMWLAPSMASRRASDESILRSRLWMSILVVQLVVGVFAITMDVRYPFSNGKAIADYVESHHLTNSTIVAVQDTVTPTIAAYLDRTLYQPAGRRFGEFIVWDARLGRDVDSLPVAVGRFASTRRPVLVVSTSSLPRELPDARLELLTAKTGAIVPEENFWLYRVEYSRPRAGGSTGSGNAGG